MHTVWKGAISFGLVNVPVKMFSATEEKDITMKTLHKDCGSPINHVKTCRTCNTEIASESILRGYEYEPSKYVTFDKDELDRLMPEANKAIKVLDFVDLHEVDPLFFQKSYYLGPAETGANAYSLLVEALKRSGKIAICNVVIRSRTNLAALRIIDDCIVMETIYYPDEIRPIGQVPNLPSKPMINDKELEMAQLLIQHLSSTFHPEKYKDEYRHQLIDLIEKKITGEEFTVAPAAVQSNVLDLMAALQASIDAAKPIESTVEVVKSTKKKVSKKAIKSSPEESVS